MVQVSWSSSEMESETSRDLCAGGFQNLFGQLYFSVSSSVACQIPGVRRKERERLCWLCWFWRRWCCGDGTNVSKVLYCMIFGCSENESGSG
jgi:hypothetical protein